MDKAQLAMKIEHFSGRPCFIIDANLDSTTSK
jgi:hypothetical protein